MPEAPEYTAWKAAYAAEFERLLSVFGPGYERYDSGFGGMHMSPEFMEWYRPRMDEWVAQHPRPERSYIDDGMTRTFTNPVPYINGPGGKLMRDPRAAP